MFKTIAELNPQVTMCSVIHIDFQAIIHNISRLGSLDLESLLLL